MKNIIPEGHKDGDVVSFGLINFNDIINENEIISSEEQYNPKSIGICKVEVYANEGDVPHFHLFSLDNSFNCCICIYSNHYFSHNKYTDKLNSVQCKQLNKWLSDPQKSDILKISNWQAIAYMWENMNQECKFPKSRKCVTQPNYNDLIDYRDK